MHDLILYDTSNFQDFPIGGQLTSVRNYLKYIAACRPEEAERILLVGITTVPEEAGKFSTVTVDSVPFAFFPVLYRDTDLANVKTSLRLEFVKALFRFRKILPRGRKIIHYLHTPEAYIAVKLLRPTAKTAVFSHGSFFNMVQGFRFFQRNKPVHFFFKQFLILLLKTADQLFVLDKTSEAQYRAYTQKVLRVENSIILPEQRPERTGCHAPLRLLFVGRLSRVKGIDRIIEAVAHAEGSVTLTIVGDGEERASLEALIAEKKLDSMVFLMGSCTPEEVTAYYRSSDVLVMNSTVEGKPMVILEAMSYGLPVLSTPVGGIPELVREGMEAEFTDGTPEQIAQKLELLRKNYAFYAENAAKQSSRFDYRTVNETIYQTITPLL